MATERRARAANPESLLIDLLADEVERDEQLIEALGGGTIDLKDVENWHDQREQYQRAFIARAKSLIAEMREDEFERNMRRTGDRTASPRHGGGPLKFDRGAPGEARAEKPPPPPQRFYLDLRDLGVGCSMRLSGSYDDILDAGSWHLRHAHKVHGDEASVRELVESAVSEVPTTRLSLEERTHGLRPEEDVSDESANRSRAGLEAPPGGYAA